MEILTNLWEAWSERLRTPFIGSILLSFIAINWQPIWYLFLTDHSAEQKFLYFDDNTMYLLPVVIGFIIALALPWIQLFGVWIAQFPRRLKVRTETFASRNRNSDQMRFKAEHTKIISVGLEEETNLQNKRNEARISVAPIINEAMLTFDGNKTIQEIIQDVWRKKLPEIAKLILIEASNYNGEILIKHISCTRIYNKTVIKAGKMLFDSRKDSEKVTQVDNAITILEESSLIRPDYNSLPKTICYKITNLGREAVASIQ